MGREDLEGAGGGVEENTIKRYLMKKVKNKSKQNYVHQEHWFTQIRSNPKHLRKERNTMRPPGKPAHLVNS